MKCSESCFNCANSFSELVENEDEHEVLHCMEKDGKVVDENGWCELYN